MKEDLSSQTMGNLEVWLKEERCCITDSSWRIGKNLRSRVCESREVDSSVFKLLVQLITFAKMLRAMTKFLNRG